MERGIRIVIRGMSKCATRNVNQEIGNVEFRMSDNMSDPLSHHDWTILLYHEPSLIVHWKTPYIYYSFDNGQQISQWQNTVP